MEAFFQFYSELFKLEKNDTKVEDMNKFMTLIPRKVSEEQVRKLDMPINVEEISDTILSMANGKSPGVDGLPAEFYKKNIDWVVDDLLGVYAKAFEVHSLGKDINKGVIKLLPKNGDKYQVKNWRPITLLNLSYKILAKLLAKRIVGMLNNIVSVSQTGFIKGKYILENLITSWEVMKWGKDSKQNVCMVLLDFEKAYDRIEWNFVIKILEKLGFPPSFYRWVNILFTRLQYSHSS